MSLNRKYGGGKRMELTKDERELLSLWRGLIVKEKLRIIGMIEVLEERRLPPIEKRKQEHGGDRKPKPQSEGTEKTADVPPKLKKKCKVVSLFDGKAWQKKMGDTRTEKLREYDKKREEK